jgi:hypothetical protein
MFLLGFAITTIGHHASDGDFDDLQMGQIISADHLCDFNL